MTKIDKLSAAITDFYISRNYVPAERREIYSYGFKLIIADMINFSIVLGLGFILGRILASVVFLITLCGIRQFSGGFHAKTFWMCRLSMVITFSCVISACYLIENSSVNMLPFMIVADIAAIIIISIFAPIKHPNKTLTHEMQRTNKIKAIISSVLLSVVSILLMTFSIREGITITITLIAVVVLMIIGFLVQRGGKFNGSID